MNELNFPSRIIVCHCEQCRGVKNKYKNRKYKKKMRRLINKKRRTIFNKVINIYWA